MSSGFSMKNPTEFAGRIHRVMSMGLGVDPDAPVPEEPIEEASEDSSDASSADAEPAAEAPADEPSELKDEL